MKFKLEERFFLLEAADIEEPVADASNINNLEETDKVPWETLYAACETKADYTAFWHGTKDSTHESFKKLGYFDYAWQQYSADIQKLGAAFTESLITYGWTGNDNIFIAFLRSLIKNPVNGISLKTLTQLDLKNLVQAYKQDLLVEKDFVQDGESSPQSLLGNYNLIYNSNFYKLSSKDQQTLLELQDKFVQNARVVTADIRIRWANFYTVGGNWKTPIKIAPGGKLVAIDKLKAILQKNGMQDDIIQDSKINAILKNFSTADDLKNAFTVAFDAFKLLSPEALESIDKAYGGRIANMRRRLTSPDFQKIAQIQAALRLPKTKYSTAQIKMILTTLGKSIDKSIGEVGV